MRGRESQEEGTARAKAQRCKMTCLGNKKELTCLEHRELEREMGRWERLEN